MAELHDILGIYPILISGDVKSITPCFKQAPSHEDFHYISESRVFVMPPI